VISLETGDKNYLDLDDLSEIRPAASNFEWVTTDEILFNTAGYYNSDLYSYEISSASLHLIAFSVFGYGGKESKYFYGRLTTDNYFSACDLYLIEEGVETKLMNRVLCGNLEDRVSRSLNSIVISIFYFDPWTFQAGPYNGTWLLSDI